LARAPPTLEKRRPAVSALPNRYHCDDVLTREQLAGRLQVDAAATYRWRDCPRLRVGREYRFVWGDVLDWLAARDTAPLEHAASSRSRMAAAGRGAVFQMPHRAGGPT
jgi:hypothetical protein